MTETRATPLDPVPVADPVALAAAPVEALARTSGFGLVRRDVLIWGLFLFLDAATQLAFKWGGLGLAGVDFGNVWLQMAFSTPAIWAGIIGYGILFVLWVAILQGSDLTRAFTVTGISFITVPLGGWLLFGEHIGVGKAFGIGLIAVGLTLMTRPQGASS